MSERGSMSDEQSPKAVRVRIAAAVDAEGGWSASGWDGASDSDKMGVVLDGVKDGEARYWIEVDLPLPTAAETITAGINVTQESA